MSLVIFREASQATSCLFLHSLFPVTLLLLSLSLSLSFSLARVWFYCDFLSSDMLCIRGEKKVYSTLSRSFFSFIPIAMFILFFSFVSPLVVWKNICSIGHRRVTFTSHTSLLLPFVNSGNTLQTKVHVSGPTKKSTQRQRHTHIHNRHRHISTSTDMCLCRWL